MGEEQELSAAQKAQQEFAEKAACATQPAVWVNKFWVAVAPNSVRLAFMEIVPPHGNVRTAIMMDKADAQSLVNTLTLLLAEGTKQ